MMNFAQIPMMSGRKGIISGLDADYQNVLIRGLDLAYNIPSDSQQIKQNQFVLSLKLAGIWNSLDLLYVFANDAGADFATLNWKSPSSFQCTQVNSPTFTTNEGFDFNGTTQYLNTNWSPANNGVNYSLNSASIGGYINENVARDSTSDWGASDNVDGVTNSIFHNARSLTGNNWFYRIHDSTTGGLSFTTLSSLALHHLQRRASNDRRVYKDGLIFGSMTTAASVSVPTSNVFIGANNANGSPLFFSNREVSFFFTGSSLAGLELSLYTAWNNYFTSL